MNKWYNYFIDIAYRTAELSNCKRRKVGALIVKDKRIISIGYNGTPSGLTKTIERICDLCNGTRQYEYTDNNYDICPQCNGEGIIIKILPDNDCEKIIDVCPSCYSEKIIKYDDMSFICNECNNIFNKPNKKTITREEVVHAEQNALMFCAKNGISTEGCDLYVTASPCINCAKLIAQAGIKNVYYKEEYRKTDGIELLRKLGINCEKIDKNI